MANVKRGLGKSFGQIFGEDKVQADNVAVAEPEVVEKVVDITILKGCTPIAGIGVKFVMQNYSQSANKKSSIFFPKYHF